MSPNVQIKYIGRAYRVRFDVHYNDVPGAHHLLFKEGDIYELIGINYGKYHFEQEAVIQRTRPVHDKFPEVIPYTNFMKQFRLANIK